VRSIKSFFLLGAIIICTQLFAQEKSGYGFKSDSTESNYQNQDALGGPKTIGSQLKVDNQKKESFYRVPIRVTKSWYDWKKKLQENTGLQLGINYTSVYMSASSVIDEANNQKNTGSGILDIQLGWNLVGRKSGKNKGTLFYKVNSRHAYGNFTAPMFHGIFESGYYGLPAVGFNDYSIRTLELNWQQNLVNDKLTIILGKVDVTNYFNFHGLIVPWTSFLGYGSSVSGTVNWPNPGIGIVAGYKITDKFYVSGALADAYGDLFQDGEFLDWGQNFFDGNFFKAVEVGWVPSMQERYFKKFSLTYWNTDSYINPSGATIAAGEGVAFSSHWFFQDKYVPYIRFAFSNGNGENAFYKKDLQIGHGLVFKSHDLLGTSFSITETNIPDTKNQATIEIYYRFHLTEHLAITPDFQWIINPTFNSNTNSLIYGGIRSRVTL
jgi:porin